jgi:hypothetical protein
LSLQYTRFQMAHLAQAAAVEVRRAERDRRRPIVSCLPKVTDTAAFLAASATMLLDMQDSLEDGADIVQRLEDEDDLLQAQRSAAALFTNSLAITNELFSKLVLAARYDCAAVQTTMDSEEPLPGVTPAVVKAIKAAHAARVDAEKKLRESKAKGSGGGWRNSYATMATVAAAAGGSQPPQPPQSHASSSHRMDLPLPLPQPVPAVSARERYPCHNCGMRGHWRADNVCRPEDVRAHIARLSAMISGGQLALPSPSGMSQTVLN